MFKISIGVGITIVFGEMDVAVVAAVTLRAFAVGGLITEAYDQHNTLSDLTIQYDLVRDKPLAGVWPLLNHPVIITSRRNG